MSTHPGNPPADHSEPFDKIQAEFDQTIEALYDLACAARQEIERFQPEILIALAHGGWGPLWAAEAVWHATRAGAFPPVLVINLGREKTLPYDKVHNQAPCAKTGGFVGNYGFPEEAGYFLAWLSRQTGWQAELRRKVLAVLHGRTPQRILFLDDMVYQGPTYRLALGLAGDTFPGCEARFLASQMLEWRHPISAPWLADHGFPTSAPITNGDSLSEDDRQERIRQGRRLDQLITGSQDATSDQSLDWLPITADSPLIQAVAHELPVETWLELPGWVQATIRAGMERLNRSEPQEAAGEVAPASIKARGLLPKEIVLKHLWLHDRITTRQAAAALNASPAEAGQILERLVADDTILPQGYGRGRHYILSPSHTIPRHERPPRPLLDAYWVAEGRLMAGDAPDRWQSEAVEAQIEWLLAQGIRSWIDLDEHDEDDEYDRGCKTSLMACAERMGIPAEYRVISGWSDVKALSQSIPTVLEAIQAANDRGLPVYLFGAWPTFRIVDTIAGCYLVSQGWEGREALEELIRRRQGCYEPWRLVPASPSLRKWVKNWRRYQPPEGSTR